MRIAVLLFILLSCLNTLQAQIQVVDSLSNTRIAGANVYTDSGLLIGSSDLNGEIHLDSLQAANASTITLNHISYQNLDLPYADFLKAKVIRMQARSVALEEVTVMDSEKYDYVVLKGYFRNYETFNNRSRYLYDGIVSYYIPINKNKGKSKMELHQYRLFSNAEANQELKDTQGSLMYFKPSINNIQSKSLLEAIEGVKGAKLKNSGNRTVIENEGLAMGYSQVGADGNTQVFYNVFPPGKKVHVSFFRIKFEVYKSTRSESYQGNNYTNPSIMDLISRVSTVSASIKRQKEHGYMPRDYSTEFYVMERSFLTKAEYKALKPNDKRWQFLEEKSKYTEEFWKDLDRFGIPPVIKSVANKIGNELKLAN
ncbi:MULTISPECIES: carboxypeptidase-like regulatory domain-containing protein [Sphingobacterium]|uniref:carboxypeptidase-like regulatory domain-containing protein n=1 Tax=Sphingobacterium TaxID=28453 RepID=UPI0011F0C241|nr:MULTISPECIES: carboxypeptidase-like regulatory domain-containing protein [Sphingobacterium]